MLCVQVLQKAICPEKRAGLDSALSAIASVTEVRLSSDLQVAKVYISIFSDDRGKETAMRQLSKLQGCERAARCPHRATCSSHGLLACQRLAAVGLGSRVGVSAALGCGIKGLRRCCHASEASYWFVSRARRRVTATERHARYVRRYARKHIGKEMSLRLTPEIRFVFDDSIERSERVRGAQPPSVVPCCISLYGTCNSLPLPCGADVWPRKGDLDIAAPCCSRRISCKCHDHTMKHAHVVVRLTTGATDGLHSLDRVLCCVGGQAAAANKAAGVRGGGGAANHPARLA